MGLFRNDKKGKAPHTWYPEILHWRPGDKVFCWNIAKSIGYIKANSSDLYKYMSGVEEFTGGFGKATFIYKSVDERGNIYLEHDDETVQFEFWRFIKSARNETLVSRKLEQDVSESENYMELMKTFQQAFDELQESDNHPKRLGEPKRNKE